MYHKKFSEKPLSKFQSINLENCGFLSLCALFWTIFSPIDFSTYKEQHFRKAYFEILD